jgi:hypothetical protein
MGWNASIRVMTTDDQPKHGARVSLHFSGIIGTHTSEYTDSDGWANFDIPEVDKYRMSIDTIYVDGEEVDSDLGLDTGDTMSYTV